MEKKIILKVLTGSRAHGLERPDSDYDYRGVFVVPTERLFQLGKPPKTTSWIEGDNDDTSWELGHFLHLATHCNPTILEVFAAPIQEVDELGHELLSLFPHIWNSTGVLNAFRGYSHNQRKKMLNDKDGKMRKYAMAYIRTLYQGTQLLNTGELPIRVSDGVIGEKLREIKDEKMSMGTIVDLATFWETKINQAFEGNKEKETNMEKVNEFLIKVRKQML